MTPKRKKEIKTSIIREREREPIHIQRLTDSDPSPQAKNNSIGNKIKDKTRLWTLSKSNAADMIRFPHNAPKKKQKKTLDTPK